ncbi:hypothetical protein [Peterkaempfera sp. SMS 1(5)a]|uniref:hypothetical protein n=1 Tax=Peterkaempfera podocarpi TaxID=3232308 RepID=UPI0036718EB0
MSDGGLGVPPGTADDPEADRQATGRVPRTYQSVVTGTQGGPLGRDTRNLRQWNPASAAAGLVPPRPPRQADERRPCAHAASQPLRHMFTPVHLDLRETIVAVLKWPSRAVTDAWFGDQT